MTVKELLESLQGLDENMDVTVTFSDGPVEHLDILGVYENDNGLEIEIGDED